MSDRPLTETPASDEIQGNVLAAFNKPFQRFVMLRLPGGNDARAWLAATTRELARSGEVAAHNALRPRPHATWVGLGLTVTGLERLDVPDIDRVFIDHAVFRIGAAARAANLGDFGASAPERWRFGNDTNPVDAVITVAADTESDVGRARDRLAGVADGHGVTIAAEPACARLPEGREHFGFRDGIGQPRVEGFDADGVAPGEFVLGWRPERGLAVTQELLQNASFQVVRQIEQDVDAWHRDGRATGDADTWGAERIGRRPDGAVLDPVPVAAHIRKAVPDVDTPRRRLLRRGIPYGAPTDDERGLVFNAFMADIARQFERVQQWANRARDAGPDAVIGAPDPADPSYKKNGAAPAWPRYVTTRGTVYAIALSLSQLEKIARG